MNSPMETQLGHDLRQLASGQPFTPDLEAIGQRARHVDAAVPGAGCVGFPSARGDFPAGDPGRPHHGQPRPAAG
jgi:hypothetical protein